MKQNLEVMDWLIWALVIIPALAIAGLVMGVEKAVWLMLLIPFLLIIKNAFLDRMLVWKPEYSVGIAACDEDHKKLLDLALRLAKALRKVRVKTEAAEVLEELADYTQTHFTREEGLMEKHDYPGLEAHKQEHELMIRKVAEFKENFEQNDIKVSKEALRFLQEWLVSHINTTDKRYTQFLNDKGER